MNKPKRICFDFDGVLSTYESGWHGPTVIPDPPVDGALDYIRQCFDAGWKVAIWSMRTADASYLEGDEIYGYRFKPERRLGIDAIKKWLLHWGLESELVDAIEFPFGKCHYTLIVEDRGYRFRGVDYPNLDDPDIVNPWMHSAEARYYLKASRLRRMKKT